MTFEEYRLQRVAWLEQEKKKTIDSLSVEDSLEETLRKHLHLLDINIGLSVWGPKKLPDNFITDPTPITKEDLCLPKK